MKQKNAVILAIVWLMLVVCVVSSVFTLMFSDGGVLGMLSAREKGQIVERYARLEEVRRILLDEYYLDVDEDILMEGAIRGMMSALNEPYTFYYSPEEMAQHAQETGESYHGVGMLVQNNPDGYIEVIRVYADGPAEQAGVKVGDLIVGINRHPVNGRNEKSLSDSLKLMRTPDGEKLLLSILRGEEKLEFELIPGEVAVNNVTNAMLDGNTGYINLFQFGSDAAQGFERALKDLLDAGAERLIVDLRNNPGGLLEAVVSIADLLLGEGLIVYTEDRAGDRENYYSDETHCDLPLVVLVNEMSASASEILASAVQDHRRGTVIGVQTFGKGIVQTLVTFDSDGAGMQYTSACYYTPKGNSIHGKGVVPDIIVESQAAPLLSGEPDIDSDMQLRVAMEWLQGA